MRTVNFGINEGEEAVGRNVLAVRVCLNSDALPV